MITMKLPLLLWGLIIQLFMTIMSVSFPKIPKKLFDSAEQERLKFSKHIPKTDESWRSSGSASTISLLLNLIQWR